MLTAKVASMSFYNNWVGVIADMGRKRKKLSLSKAAVNASALLQVIRKMRLLAWLF